MKNSEELVDLMIVVQYQVMQAYTTGGQFSNSVARQQ